MIEFVSYNGGYPNLCRGTLILRIDGVERIMPPYCMNSGGSVTYDKDGEYVMRGRWSVDVPKDLVHYKQEIEDCVNNHVPYGCCGGCL